jgi:hypothetical protein
MKFQLIVQWSSTPLPDFEEIVEIEDLLIAKLKSLDEVDGHDFGAGEANIFIITSDPQRAFSDIRAALEGHQFWGNLSAAYREIGGGDFLILWPKGLTTFNVR